MPSKNTTKDFLENHRSHWQDWNIPYADGEALYKLIVDNKFTSVLEIGTSSGHSTIWLSYAMQQTGGKVTTIEIDQTRYKKAIKNFELAGVSHLIDARLGDALHIIPTLTETFDFIFSDATLTIQPKESYLLFFKAADPKLRINGLYTMHNVTDGFGDDGRFFKYVDNLGSYQTSIIRASSAGISVSKKIKSK